ncbi:MAG: FAD:protein FMN transferase [Nocardioides sp.]|nr:FAD:protein FMN transferase [Nocardioides sp.]
MTTHHTTFPAIGTQVFVAVRRPEGLATARSLAAGILDDVDAVCSRFRPDSDLSRVNAHPGRWVEVDPLLTEAVRVACVAAEQTDGLVSPLLGRTLVQLGYDRDFSLLRDRGEGDDSDGGPPAPDAWRSIETGQGMLRIPDGSALDLGCTGKAWAADLIATAYEHHGLGPAIVSVGGDLRIASPDGSPWPVAVSEMPDADPDTLVALDRGGLATSSTQVRRWTHRGVRRHHLLDPRTGRPVDETWRTVTAVGETCVAANTATTTALVLGADAPQWLASQNVTARLVARDGTVRTVGAWPEERNVA